MKKVLKFVPVLVIVCIIAVMMVVPASATSCNSSLWKMPVDVSSLTYFVRTNDNTTIVLYTTSSDDSFALVNNGSNYSIYTFNSVQSTSNTFTYYISRDAGQTWPDTGKIFTTSITGTEMSTTSYNCNKTVALYSSTSNVPNTPSNASFFRQAPLPFNLVPVVQAAQPVQILAGVAAVLGGCLILLILSRQFRNGFRFLSQGLHRL